DRAQGLPCLYLANMDEVKKVSGTGSSARRLAVKEVVPNAWTRLGASGAVVRRRGSELQSLLDVLSRRRGEDAGQGLRSSSLVDRLRVYQSSLKAPHRFRAEAVLPHLPPVDRQDRWMISLTDRQAQQDMLDVFKSEDLIQRKIARLMGIA